MTPAKKTRIAQAATETREILSREMLYPEDLRDASMVTFCENHLARLASMLEAV